ncbi:MAG: protein TolR [Pseudomonadota bacterium]
MGGAQMADANASRRKRRRRSRAALSQMSEINVTPFVDVMLVLLIIFMVAAPLLTTGVPVRLPETAAEALPSTDETPLTVTVGAEGELSIQNEPVPADNFIPRLAAMAEERRDRQIFLRADQGIAYGRVMEVMGALNAAGFTRIGLVTEPGGPELGGE